MVRRDHIRNRLLAFRGRLQVLLDPECSLSPDDLYLEYEAIEREVNECLRELDSPNGEVAPFRLVAMR